MPATATHDENGIPYAYFTVHYDEITEGFTDQHEALTRFDDLHDNGVDVDFCRWTSLEAWADAGLD